MTSKRTTRAVAGLVISATLMLVGASAAHAQTGGIPGGTEPPTTTTQPTAQTAGSWTVYKKATWYGPGFWGKSTSCGQVLAPTVIGVAHRKLPCGTQVNFTFNGVSVPATVIDRGPFSKGYAWDLTKKTAKRLGFLAIGSGPIQATIMPTAIAPTAY